MWICPAERFDDLHQVIEGLERVSGAGGRCPEGSLQFSSRLQELACGGTVRIKKIDALVTAKIVCCVDVSVYALISKCLEFPLYGVRQVSVDEKVDVLGRADDVVWRKGEPADQSKSGSDLLKGGDRFFELPA